MTSERPPASWSSSEAPEAPLGGGDRFDDGLARLGDEGRGDDAARSRSRGHWLRRQALEQATLAGVLVDLAERGDRVVITTALGRRHRGWVRSVGVDFFSVEADTGQDVVIRLAALASLRSEPGRPPVDGDREMAAARTLADHLATVSDDRPRVLVSTTTPDEAIAGVLQSVGRDVMVVALDGHDRASAYVPVASVVEVSFPVSG